MEYTVKDKTYIVDKEASIEIIEKLPVGAIYLTTGKRHPSKYSISTISKPKFRTTIETFGGFIPIGGEQEIRYLDNPDILFYTLKEKISAPITEKDKQIAFFFPPLPPDPTPILPKVDTTKRCTCGVELHRSVDSVCNECSLTNNKKAAVDNVKLAIERALGWNIPKDTLKDTVHEAIKRWRK